MGIFDRDYEECIVTGHKDNNLIRVVVYTPSKNLALKCALNTYNLETICDVVKTSNEWEYGTCNGNMESRRHKRHKNVQFLLWKIGDQKHVDGVGHTKDSWINYDPSWWGSFKNEIGRL